MKNIKNLDMLKDRDTIKIYIDEYREKTKDNKSDDELIEQFDKEREKEYERIKKEDKNKYKKLKEKYDEAMNYYKKTCKGIYLINSENNNDADKLGKLNKIIKENDIKMLICSPSLGIGLSVDVKLDGKGYYFDRMFVHLTGKSTSAIATQQMMNRCRNFQYNEHYIYFDNINQREKNN